MGNQANPNPHQLLNSHHHQYHHSRHNHPHHHQQNQAQSQHSNNHEHNLSHHPRGHHNWRKSKSHPGSGASKRSAAASSNGAAGSSASLPSDRSPYSLLNLSAKIVAEHIPFQSIEQRYAHIPEPVQRQIIFWSFPRHEDDIKMYSSLSTDVLHPSSAMANSSTTSHSNNTTQSPSSDQVLSRMDHPSLVQGQGSSQAPGSASAIRNSQNSKQLAFHKGLRLYNDGCVQDALQVGFNLSGIVTIKLNPSSATSSNSKIRGNGHTNGNNNINNLSVNNHNNNNQLINQQNVPNDLLNNQNQPSTSPNESPISPSNESFPNKSYRVSVTFDRCKITSVSCSCEAQDIFWCEHVVALVLHRIRNPETIDLRIPISETLLSLDRQQLQKLVQYIIAEHYTEVLPTAQRLLDEMTQSLSEINQVQGAPDPTAGACATDEHIWHLDEHQVNIKVKHYLTLVFSNSNSKDAVKKMNALFEKIREMFRAKDSNGTRLLKLITEQFLQFATRNEKSRPLWDQLISLWVVVMLNPDLPESGRAHFLNLLMGWSKVSKCPKEDVERRVSLKRKAHELSDDEDGDDYSANNFCSFLPVSFNQSNNYPAHMATHRHRAFQSNNALPVLRPYNQYPIIPSPPCPCHLLAKKMRSQHAQHNGDAVSRGHRQANSSNHHPSPRNASSSSNAYENRPAIPQEPRSVFFRAMDFKDISWDDPHLQLILNKYGPVDFDTSGKSHLFDYAGNPLWDESISVAAARVETLRSHGYREQALRLTVATVRRLKLYQDQWCIGSSTESSPDSFASKSSEVLLEGWIGHPFDPINVMVDILLEASSTEAPNVSTNPVGPTLPCSLNLSRCSCPYNQVLADFTHRVIPDLLSLSYQSRLDTFPSLPPLNINLTPRRATGSSNLSNPQKTPYYHIPVPGCCQKDSYLTLAVELALMALGQQRSIATTATAHDRAVRQEYELIAKLESIDTSDPLLIEILKHQTTLLLEGGPFQNSFCGVPTDPAPLHTFARYLFDSLVPHYPQIAYKVGFYALKMPLLPEENGENFGVQRASPRSINYNHLQSEQLALAQTMLSRTKDEGQLAGYLKNLYRASVKNIRNPASLLKLSKHVLKEAKPSGTILHPALMSTSFNLGLQVLKTTLSQPHTPNGKTRREATIFVVECATDIGLEAVFEVMRDSRDYFSAIDALNLVVARDNDHVNLRSQAITKLKLNLKENELRELDQRSRNLVLDCSSRDPAGCALEALKFCETDDESLKRALKIVIDAGVNRTMDSSQLIRVADHFHERKMTDKAFEISMVAISSLTIPSNSDNSSSKKDILSACKYAQEVNGFSTLLPKLIHNIECATVLSEIYETFRWKVLTTPPTYRNYNGDVMPTYRNNFKGYGNYMLNSLNQEDYRQKVEDARWWDALLERTLKAFVDTTRTRLQNISPRHYPDFIEFLTKAQGTFEKASDGPQQFKDLISEIMKSYRTKKKLMERLRAKFDHAIKVGL